MSITYMINEGGAYMLSANAAEVAEHVVRAGATYIVQGTPDEQAEGKRRVEREIQKLRGNG
jgi:uncharacterized protein (DUF1330 family)